MTGTPPTAVASVDQPLYRRGATVTARVDITDPDNRTEPMASDGTDPVDGTAVHIVEQRYHSDIPHVVWRYQGSTATLGTGLTLTLLAPARSVVLEAVVTDAQGHTVVAAVDVVVRTLAVGVDVQGAATSVVDIDTHLAAHGLYAGCTGSTKLFWPAGKGLPTFDGVTTHVPAAMVPHLCFADMPTQAQWLSWLDGVPVGPWREVWVTWAQEGDRKMSAAAFQAGWQQLVAWTATHPRGGRVKLVANVTWYFQHNKNGDGYAAYIPAGVSYLGVDIYPGMRTGYTPPADCLAAPVAAAAAAGVPLVIPECGVVVPANPSAAQLQARADWYQGLIDGARDAGVEFLSIWCTTGAQDAGSGGFHLVPGDPAYDVVRAAMAQ